MTKFHIFTYTVYVHQNGTQTAVEISLKDTNKVVFWSYSYKDGKLNNKKKSSICDITLIEEENNVFVAVLCVYNEYLHVFMAVWVYEGWEKNINYVFVDWMAFNLRKTFTFTYLHKYSPNSFTWLAQLLKFKYIICEFVGWFKAIEILLNAKTKSRSRRAQNRELTIFQCVRKVLCTMYRPSKKKIRLPFAVVFLQIKVHYVKHFCVRPLSCKWAV